MKILSLLFQLFAAVCTATVLAQGIGLGMLWSQGQLTQEKFFLVLTAFYDVRLDSLREERREKETRPDSEQASMQAVIEQRALASLNLQLRETAVDKGLLDLRAIEETLRTDRVRYDQLKSAFDGRLAELERSLLVESIEEVQLTLESLQPRQAKDQILRILAEDEQTRSDQAMHDVVAILKAMPIDKRRKILGEFKTEEEAAKLHDILLEIRDGEPDVSLIRKTREELKGV
ncbi:hypothetical protein [Lignipirellula cremea]|uniref:Uncharacterized protein n=1 Tax=Lignipirellula cremea TaxID=2528010 RepID=A0A518DRY0_9BACT|nr:hypothetical protein [Lignipirellula cremea]QDU94583.1 hypothetical protein Pla8534_23760 [Lignipirellula cremea]